MKAARLNLASGRRATAALTKDISAPMSSQLAAKGHQAVKTSRVVMGLSLAVLMVSGVVTQGGPMKPWDPRFLVAYSRTRSTGEIEPASGCDSKPPSFAGMETPALSRAV